MSIKDSSVSDNNSLADFGLDLLIRPTVGAGLYFLFKKITNPYADIRLTWPLVMNSLVMGGGILASEFAADGLSRMGNFNN